MKISAKISIHKNCRRISKNHFLVENFTPKISKMTHFWHLKTNSERAECSLVHQRLLLNLPVARTQLFL